MPIKITRDFVTFASLLLISSVTFAVDFEDSIEDTSFLEYQQATALMMDTDIDGNPKAQYELAFMFQSGSKGYVDMEQAKILYNLSAENGYKQAQKYLAVAYSDGSFGFEKNQQLSQYWQSVYNSKFPIY